MSELKLNQFTQETFPKGIIYIKPKKGSDFLMVTIVGALGVGTEVTWDDYSSLLNNHLISTDLCETWQTAGVISDE